MNMKTDGDDVRHVISQQGGRTRIFVKGPRSKERYGHRGELYAMYGPGIRQYLFIIDEFPDGLAKGTGECCLPMFV